MKVILALFSGFIIGLFVATHYIYPQRTDAAVSLVQEELISFKLLCMKEDEDDEENLQ